MLHNVNKALTYSKTTPKYKVVSVVYWTHRHLREIDCSSAIVGGPAAGPESGANQYTCHACGAKKCFIAAAAAGNITTTVNKGRQAGPMSSLLLLDVYGSCPNVGTWTTTFSTFSLEFNTIH